MSGRFISGGVHWRIDGDDRPAIARLRSEGLKLLGVLRDALGSTPSGGILRVYMDGAVRVEYADKIPIVTISVGSAGGDLPEADRLFMDSGLFVPADRSVFRQTLQVLAQAAHRSWLGNMIFDAQRTSVRFDSKNRNGTAALDGIAPFLPLIRVSGRARLLQQALLGRMDSAGAGGLAVMAGFPGFGVALINGRYYCLTADGATAFAALMPFRLPARKVAALEAIGDEEKREAYLLSLADLGSLQWHQIGTMEVLGDPLAYGWNWSWSGLIATMTTHVIVDSGASASFTARTYHLTVRVNEYGALTASASISGTERWYPRRQTTNIWYPSGLGVVCIVPPLSSASYPDDIEYDAPIYSFYRKNGDECVVRLSHHMSVVSGKNEFTNNPTICGLGSSGWRYTYSSYVKHAYRAYCSGADAASEGFGYSAIGAKTDREYFGSGQEIGVFAFTDALVNDCPAGSADDIPNPGNTMVDTGYSQFTVTESNDLQFTQVPHVAVIVSPYDCEAVTLLSSESFNRNGTETTMREVGSNTYMYNFVQHSVVVERSPHQQLHDYTTISSERKIDSSAAYNAAAIGRHSIETEAGDNAGQAAVFLSPTIYEMVSAQNPSLFRQGAIGCSFMQKPSDKSAYWSIKMNREASVFDAFSGWA